MEATTAAAPEKAAILSRGMIKQLVVSIRWPIKTDDKTLDSAPQIANTPNPIPILLYPNRSRGIVCRTGDIIVKVMPTNNTKLMIVVIVKNELNVEAKMINAEVIKRAPKITKLRFLLILSEKKPKVGSKNIEGIIDKESNKLESTIDMLANRVNNVGAQVEKEPVAASIQSKTTPNFHKLIFKRSFLRSTFIFKT